MFNQQSSDFMAESSLDYIRQFELLNASNSVPFERFFSKYEGLVGDFSDLSAAFYDPSQVYDGCLRDGGVVNDGVRKGLEEFGTQKNEKQRRERLGKKFETLKSLIPNPTKSDRASILSDTMDYIKELLRTVDDLKLLIVKKRSKNATSIKLERENELQGDIESSSMKSAIDENISLNGSSLRNSWIQRRSKSTFVDVRIIEDEVYIKIEQHKRVDCSLIVSRVLDELQLELMHFSGGNVGDSHVFMISTKTNYEGAPLFASTVARRFIEVMSS